MIAAIYARKSTDQHVAEEAKSVTRQVESARAYATRKGWTVAEEHVYVDDGISGAEFLKRPDFLRLMNALKPRAPFQVLIMSEDSRLGREQIETAYALKQIIGAGVRVFYYLDDRERTLDSPTEKLLLSVAGFADEMEREKGRQRTTDAMHRLAAAGHVTGGRVFGYDNVGVVAPSGKRSHVERHINAAEAVVVRRIFTLAAAGSGLRAIAHTLNAEAAPAPRPRPVGRPTGWAPSSIREVLHRELYRGLVVWNKRKKRDQWGVKHVRPRPAEDWIRRDAPELRIVDEGLWQGAHQRIAGTRATYLRGTSGRLWGRPANGIESKYLLTGLAACGWCGGTLEVRSGGGPRVDRRRHFYGCTSYHRRGTTVCRNRYELLLAPTEQAVLDAVEQKVLDPQVVAVAITEAMALLRRPAEIDPARATALQSELHELVAAMGRLTAAIRLGGPLPSLVADLQSAERRRMVIEQTLRPAPPVPPAALERVEALLDDWRGLFRKQVPFARQALRVLLDGGRAIFTPQQDGQMVEVVATCTLDRLFMGLGTPQTVVTPGGCEDLGGRAARDLGGLPVRDIVRVRTRAA